jgi:hypothetical protein
MNFVKNMNKLKNLIKYYDSWCFSSFRFMVHFKSIMKFMLHLILYKRNVIPAVVLSFDAENIVSKNEQNINIVFTIAFIIVLMTWLRLKYWVIND